MNTQNTIKLGGECPKCMSVLSLNKTNGNIVCAVCGLQIVDSVMSSDRMPDSNKESDMETHLMPDEATIASKEPKMQWQAAVTTVDNVIQEWLIDHDGQSEERVTGVLAAWHRILQG